MPLANPEKESMIVSIPFLTSPPPNALATSSNAFITKPIGPSKARKTDLITLNAMPNQSTELADSEAFFPIFPIIEATLSPILEINFNPSANSFDTDSDLIKLFSISFALPIKLLILLRTFSLVL